jgi:hypothetical protein
MLTPEQRVQWKNEFRTALARLMVPNGQALQNDIPEGPQRFGEYFIHVKGRKHKDVVRAIICVSRGASAREAQIAWTLSGPMEYLDPLEQADEVAQYLHLKGIA